MPRLPAHGYYPFLLIHVEQTGTTKETLEACRGLDWELKVFIHAIAATGHTMKNVYKILWEQRTRTLGDISCSSLYPSSPFLPPYHLFLFLFTLLLFLQNRDYVKLFYVHQEMYVRAQMDRSHSIRTESIGAQFSPRSLIHIGPSSLPRWTGLLASVGGSTF